MSIAASTQIIQCFGFHTRSTFNSIKLYPSEIASQPEEIDHFTVNILNGLTVIPLISNVIGGSRVFGYKEEYLEKRNISFKPFIVTQIVRGVLEMLFLGPLLFLIDLIVTLGRYIAYKCTGSQVANVQRITSEQVIN